jgi:hypothetical protein
LSVSEETLQRAAVLEERIEEELSKLPALPPPSELFRILRHYLQQRADEDHPGNNVFGLIRLQRERNKARIHLGPSIDKGPTSTHFRFASGARLSFGVSLRDVRQHSDLVAYRFHMAPPKKSPFLALRFDLNETGHANPLYEPRCHFHLGGDVRLPCPVLNPLEVLDRIFYVLEPAFRER